MEHQVFVPVPADDLRAVLRDPARVARCVPGLQQDADTGSGPLAGRLKVRVDGHTVTYRGALSLTERDPGHFAVEGEGTEVRGNGAVKLSLTLRLTPVEGGTRLDLTGGGEADGRAAAFTPQATATAVRRLLDRAAEQLAAVAAAAAAAEAAGPEVSDPVADAEETEDARDTGRDDSGDEVTEVSASVFDADVPPPSLDPFLESEFTDLGDLGAVPPPAEAAHARRTMIGRSAEEVDHAPPRGRYAPVPAAAPTAAGDNLRWIAPAAALVVASAVVLGRALRRRR
ncbi:SRPBCC family protein [Streptomyces sp. NBC_01408]|uniref:SRPBCC family protein n=1 Tax=Streptomyces sp. NBC_01408 TaxID=2903855 RepID=UPI002257CDF0|nr:SRPBCC family protein [Streptomyces sp. NBC_01408]MCX4692415.1 SRPBCC family protein [Streptomyces sp. NBC_01408]